MIPYNDSQLKPNKNKRVYIIKFQNDNKMKLKTYITIMLMFIIGSCGNDDKPEDPALREIELMKKEEELRKREEELVKRELDVLKWETQNDTLKIEDITKDTLNIVDDIQNTELTHDKKIELIRKEYNNINNNIKSYSKETKELSGFSDRVYCSRTRGKTIFTSHCCTFCNYCTRVFICVSHSFNEFVRCFVLDCCGIHSRKDN